MFDTDFGIYHHGEMELQQARAIQWVPNITRYRPCSLKLMFDQCGFLDRKYFEEYSLKDLKTWLENPELEYVYRIQTRTFLKHQSQLHSYFYFGFLKDKQQDIIIKAQIVEDPADNSNTEYFLPVTMALHHNDIIRMFQQVIDTRYNIENSLPCVCTCGECDPEYFPRCVLANLSFDDFEDINMV